MTIEELYSNLDDLGYKAFAEISGIGLDDEGNLNSAPEIWEKLYKNPKKYFNNLYQKDIVGEIQEKYNELVKRATEEEYYHFKGTNYNVLVKCVLRDMSNYNDVLTGYEEEDYIKVQIKNMKYFLKNSLIKIENITPEFELGCDAYILFLNVRQYNALKRNLKKAIKILKNELTRIENSKFAVTSEKVSFDNQLNDIEKLAYLYETGLLSHLVKNNSINTTARLIMKFINFDTEKVDTIVRYIKICLNEPNHLQYPKNTENIKDYLQKIKFKKE
ncbi:hypothetical protein [Gaetbulibacter sp. PBL-D1]|uniref:hypothetical protein n=1 Tax=Gaetbulibacter sp. PBL-D1 TaxID=3422594 RepID=UPI003D2EE931